MIKINRVDVWDAHRALGAINRLRPQLSPSKKVKPLALEELGECLQDKNFHLFVAEDMLKDQMSSLLGMGSIFFQKNLGSWIAEIHDIVVDKKERDKGFGKKIVARLIEEAKEFASSKKGPIKLYLTSRPNRVKANNLYIKLGFVLVAKATGKQGTNLYKMVIKP